MTLHGTITIEGGFLDDIAERYSVFLVDQFGVLHDGAKPYAGTIAALERLKRDGKRIVLLSNSGKRSASNVARLASLGFEPAMYDAMLTSGEVAWRLLKQRMIGRDIARGARCLLLARDNDRSAIEGLELRDATDGNDAELILLAGSRGDTVGMDHYQRLLEPAARRGVPCLCTNPDKIMLTEHGPRFGAGAIADKYAAMGGNVRWLGKPLADIYTLALEEAGHPDVSDVCCIGDSIEHDIAGGARAGLRTALVRTGILEALDANVIEALCGEHDVHPDHMLRRFSFHDGDQ